MKPTKPLWGFGWAGWCLVPVAAWLTWCYFVDVDLRFKLLKLINDTWGIKAVYSTVLGPCTHNWLALRTPGLGWWGLLYVPIAVHLHPSRSWLWCIPLAGWAVWCPGLYYQWVARPPGSGPMAPVVAASHGLLDLNTAAVLVCCLIDVALLVTITRSIRVFVATMGATALSVAGEGVMFARAAPVSEQLALLPTYLWHSVALGAMLAWGVRARMRAARTGCCKGCGYDLSGLHQARCPECGTAFGDTGVVRAVGGIAGVHSPP